MTDLALMLCFIMYVVLGCMSPFILSLGYVWVDTMLPHALSYGLLSSIPLAFIMGAGAVFMYMATDRRSPPKVSGLQFMIGVLAIWVTLTATWAVSPNMAWTKWDPSFKTLIFTIFLPFVFRTRVQIEAFVLTLVFASAPHLLPWGVKTFLTGGGYGMSLGLLPSMVAWISESSGIAAISVMFIPILAWIRVHSILLPWPRLRNYACWSVSLAYLVATIGTFARTGLIGMGVLGIGMFLRSRRKVAFLFAALIAGGVLFSATSDKWTSRISTVKDYSNESSAETRIKVWQWTWEFAKTHPFGGGFNSFVVNVIRHPGPDGTETLEFGRAFHNIYFSALGEHGYPGVLLYVSVLVTALLTAQSVIRQCKNRPELEWAGDLARANQLGLVIMMTCGMFIDVSFVFILWDLVALAMCLKAHVARSIVTETGLRTLPARLQGGPAVPIPQFR